MMNITIAEIGGSAVAVIAVVIVGLIVCGVFVLKFLAIRALKRKATDLARKAAVNFSHKIREGTKAPETPDKPTR